MNGQSTGSKLKKCNIWKTTSWKNDELKISEEALPTEKQWIGIDVEELERATGLHSSFCRSSQEFVIGR